MNSYLGDPQARRRSSGLISVFVFLVMAAAPAFSQVPDPIFSDPTDPAYTGPAPMTRNTVTTPNLANLNENADTVQYVDRESGPFNIGVDLKSGYGDNLFSQSGNSHSGVSAGFGIPAGLRLKGKTTQFDANYRFDKTYYPEFSKVDDFSQSYSQQLEHHSTERTSYFWNLAAGRISSIGHYLPSFVGIGSTGVSQGTVGSSASQNSYTTSNAATSLGVSHLASERDQMSGTVTLGWIQQAQQGATHGTASQILRSELAGLDLRSDHAIDPRSKIGVELTNIYVRGLAPRGHQNYTAVEVSYGRTLTSHFDFRGAAGPLFSTSSGSGGSQSNGFSYAASAGLDYKIAHTLMGFTYARVVQLSYIQVATTANQFGFLFDRELSPTVDLTLDTRYVRADSSAAAQRDSQFGLTGRVNKRIGSNLLLFISASRSQQRTPSLVGINNSYDRDDVFGGVTLLFGNPIYRRGVH